MNHVSGNAPDRKNVPVATGVLDYFPDALVDVARLSRAGNEQHNPGEPLHWSREKSDDHDDCLARHFIDRGRLDADGIRHSAKVAWRALAILQLEIEAGPVATNCKPGVPTGSTTAGWIQFPTGFVPAN